MFDPPQVTEVQVSENHPTDDATTGHSRVLKSLFWGASAVAAALGAHSLLSTVEIRPTADRLVNPAAATANPRQDWVDTHTGVEVRFAQLNNKAHVEAAAELMIAVTVDVGGVVALSLARKNENTRSESADQTAADE